VVFVKIHRNLYLQSDQLSVILSKNMISTFFHWDINPEIINTGGFALRYYSLFFVTGLISGYLILKKIYKLESVPVEKLDRLAIYVFLGTIIGARLGHCLFYEPVYYLKHPLEVILPFQGTIGKDFKLTGYQGLASHGGAIGVFLAVFLYSRKYKQPLLWVLDRLAIVVALAGCCIRLGNFMNSEIIGSASSVPWAIVFDRVDNIPRHPAQLYEALSYLIIFGSMFILYFRKKGKLKPGFLFGIFLIVLFSMRFLLEFLKENQEGFENGMLLNMGQLLSIPFILIGIAILFKKKPNSQ
jgi:prolipoprotein diacylglyceryl transferase